MASFKSEARKVLEGLKKEALVQAFSIISQDDAVRITVEPEAGVDLDALTNRLGTELPKPSTDVFVDIVIKKPIAKVKTSQVREMLDKFGAKK